MHVKPKLGKSDSKKTLNSMWMENEPLNESMDLDSEEPDRKGTKVRLMRSIFENRPSTVFF